MTLLYLFSLLSFLIWIGWLASRLVRRSLTEWLLMSYLLGAGSVILTGFLLSWFRLTAQTPVWAVAVFVTAAALGFGLRPMLPPQTEPVHVGDLWRQRRRETVGWFGRLALFPKTLFTLLFLAVSGLAVTNLLLVLFTVPNEWDSMTGHLNRVMQYIQRGSMRHFGGTNWNIDTYPKSVCTLQIYSFLITGRFENAFKFIHHLAYWSSVVAMFGIVQRIGALLRSSADSRLSASFFCALAFALLPNVLMQATTTETDIVLTSYLAALLFWLFSYRSSNPRDVRYLVFAGMAFGIAFGHKITFVLLLPSIFAVMVYAVFWSESLTVSFGRTWRLGLVIVVAMCLWTLPTGYLKNIEVFGHPIGPPTALRHQSVERAGSARNLLEQGSRNVVRYMYDHLNLDGIRNTDVGANLNRAMRQPVVKLENKLRLRLDEETDFSIQPFLFERRFLYVNANPYWGIFGFGLVLPLLILAVLGAIGWPKPLAKLRAWPMAVLGSGLVLHWLTLSYSAPYDPFKGRYFIETALFGIPLLALLFLNQSLRIDQRGRVSISQIIWRGYVGLVVGLGCVSAVLAVFMNVRALPLPWNGRPSAFQNNRIRQMTMGRPDIYQPYQRVDELVPDTATIALGTINDDYEYPLYGPRLSRRLIPINPFEQGLQPIPKDADYLFFAKTVIRPQPGDLRLGTDTTMTVGNGVAVKGEDYYLRKIK
jgi:hypothetical protein